MNHIAKKARLIPVDVQHILTDLKIKFDLDINTFLLPYFIPDLL